ncbi:MAG: hypothetical protein K2L98_00890 [Bacilli bacterium]|nr:hypothetical protein [Bacilli bacterium]
MKIYVMYTKLSFTSEQIKSLESVGEVIFCEEVRTDLNYPYMNDDDNKVLMVDPDWYNWNIDKEHLSKISNLKGVALATTAYDWIDLDYCRENNIVVTNTPKYSTSSVAEYAVFLMMSLAKKFPMQIKNNYETKYNDEMMGTEVRGKTAGFVCLGTIGEKIADMCNGLGMNVIYWNRSEKKNNYKRVEIEEIFKTADFIFPTFSTNEETKKLITDDLINMMNNQALINVVNNSKEIFNHELMLEKAKDGIVSYAFERYDDKKMEDYEGNVMVSAPYAFFTKESIARLMALWVSNTIETINGNCENSL